MVCSIGGGRMAAMARLLAAGSFSQIIAEEVGNQKLASQYVQRGLCHADEANLLDEEDMHVYDLKPLTDPLHLVCCNACKKPIKISQYATHAELCKSLRSAEEMVVELNGGTGRKKPPRKERKKLIAAYAFASSGEQERFESAEPDIKRNSSSVNEAAAVDGSGVSPGNSEYSTDAMPLPTKRSKLIPAEAVHMLDHLRKTSDVAKSLCIGTSEANTCKGISKGSSGGCEKTSDCVESQKPGQVHGFCLRSKDIPAPLATKMFYSQRNHRLQSALKYMYYESFSQEHPGDVNLNASQRDEMELQVLSHKNSSYEKLDVWRQKGQKHSLPSIQTPEQVPADSSDVYMGKLGHKPAMNFTNHDPVNNAFKSQAVSMGNMKSKHLSKPFSFAGNSGTPLGTMQQPQGSVPVT